MVIIESHVLCRSKKNLKFLLYTRPPPLLTHMIKFGTLICVGMQVSVVGLIVIQTSYINNPSRVLVASMPPEVPSVLQLTPTPVTFASPPAVVQETPTPVTFASPPTVVQETPKPEPLFPEQCVQAPPDPGEVGCISHAQKVCLFRDLTIYNNLIYSPRQALTLDVINIGPLVVHSPPPVLAVPTKVLDGLTVVLHRMYPGNYAHATRDTLAHAFFAHQTFYPGGDLHMVFVDGVQTVGNVREVMYAIGNTTLEGTGQEVIWARRAVVGMFGHSPVDSCNHHYLRPRGWRALANVMAMRHSLVPPNSQNKTVIWFVNRNQGETREVTNMGTIVASAKQAFTAYNCVDVRPGSVNLSMQVTLAQSALIIVGPHGSNLASMIWGGPDVSVVELLAASFHSGWWYGQAVYQGSLWVSVPGRLERLEDIHDLGNGRIEPDPDAVKEQIQGLLRGYPIRCQHPGLPVAQACTFAQR